MSRVRSWRYGISSRWAAVLLVATSCAIPRDNTTFSLSRRGLSGDDEVFASSKDLRVAGLVSEGLAFANNGRLFNAEGRLRQAYYLEPTNDRIAFNLAVIANQLGESDEALSMIEALLIKQPRNPNYLQALADVLESRGEHELAKVKLKEAFSLYKAAGNAPRAAFVARSISNVSFGTGNEQEALCYSYEAFSLAPTPQQVSAHARLLVGLNLFDQAIEFIQTNKPLAGDAASFHALAMALFAKGDMKAALEAEDNAVGRISQAPELAQEINSAWWIMNSHVSSESPATDESEVKIAELKEGAIQFVERQPYELVMWPADLRRELVTATTVS